MPKGPDLTSGKVSKTILAMTLPMMVGMIGIVIFNLVDTFFIGKLSTTALAAMSFTLPVVMLQGAISMGLGVGVAAVVSKAIGQKDHSRVKRLTTDALILSVLLVVTTIIIGLLTIDPLFSFLGANSEQLVLIKEYMTIWYIGVPFVVIPMVGNNAIRATGNTTIPSVIMLVAVFVNIILDPILIFGYGPFPRMELAGAALATLIARMTTLTISLLFLHFKFQMLSFRIPTFKELVISWKEILYVSVPAALTQVLLPLSMGFLTRLVSEYGENAVAAVGVANRIEMFALSPIMALGAVIIPFTGQNLGAKKRDRITKGLTYSSKLSFYLGLFLIVLFTFFSTGIAKVFNPNMEVVTYTSLYLMIVSLGYAFQSMNRLSSSTFSALNLPLHAAGVNFLRLILLFIPLSYMGSKYWGLPGIFAGIAIASFFSGIISLIWCKKEIQHLKI